MKNVNRLKILEGEFSIHRLSPDNVIPRQVYDSEFYSITKADGELSIVCDSSIQLTAEKSNEGWKCIKFIGVLDLSLTGILNRITTVLVKSKISIFALSTYNTDYLLVETSNIIKAKQSLITAGYVFEE